MKVFQHLDLGIGSSILADDSILYTSKDPTLDSSWHWTIEHKDLNSKFLKLLADKNLKIIHAEIFKTNFLHKSWPIHIDADNGIGDVPKINWVYGDLQCPMIWYKLKNEDSRTEGKITATGTGYYDFDPDTVEEIDRAFVGRPSIIQSGVPHTVINSNNKNRWCVSIVVKKDDQLLTFEQLVKEFIEYTV